jgi:hypothetical protein
LKIRIRENPVRKGSIFKDFSSGRIRQNTAIYRFLSLRDERLCQGERWSISSANLKSKPDKAIQRLRPFWDHHDSFGWALFC